MFNSQDKQDEYLEKNVFKGYKKGFFVDVGAHDGKTINNTLYFETANNWKGINVEPIKDVYDQLVVNRPKCINLNCAIDEKEGQSEFIYNKGYTEMISGLKNHYDPRHHNRLANENNHFGSTSHIINVDTNTLSNIFNKYGVKHVNYLSIDVEGAEFAVIKSIDFDNVFIDVIGFENNYNDTSLPIVDYLQNKGYVILHRSMDIFMIHNKSNFI
jgi:FkbM family methyltransferase